MEIGYLHITVKTAPTTELRCRAAISGHPVNMSRMREVIFAWRDCEHVNDMDPPLFPPPPPIKLTVSFINIQIQT